MAASNDKASYSKFMPSGYEYEFVLDVPDEYICQICFSPMWKPVQTKCGHRFCKDCLEEANRRLGYEYIEYIEYIFNSKVEFHRD
jgi:hypothetical protein